MPRKNYTLLSYCDLFASNWDSLEDITLSITTSGIELQMHIYMAKTLDEYWVREDLGPKEVC